MRRRSSTTSSAGRRDDPGGCARYYLSVLLEHLEPEQTGLEKLELLVVTGEALKPNLVGRWFGKYPRNPDGQCLRPDRGIG
ncbi:hypothetical protein P7H20_19085 [Paenibacillus larvae]|nr:hypothetical protein [Paenibacillus larvae]MDT2276505.1 hypothetical protein [Paenibacillus larvae]